MSDTPTKAVLLVYTNPPVGREAACDEWYDRVHIPDMLSVPGVTGANRLLLDGDGTQQVGRDGELAVARSLVIYTLDTSDIAQVRAAIGQNMARWREDGRTFDGLQVVSSAAYINH